MGWEGGESYKAVFPSKEANEFYRILKEKCEKVDRNSEDYYYSSTEETLYRYEGPDGPIFVPWKKWQNLSKTEEEEYYYEHPFCLKKTSHKNNFCLYSISFKHYTSQFSLEKLITLIKMYPSATIWKFSCTTDEYSGMDAVVILPKDCDNSTDEKIVENLLISYMKVGEGIGGDYGYNDITQTFRNQLKQIHREVIEARDFCLTTLFTD